MIGRWIGITLAFVLAGCGSDGPERKLDLVPVSGTVQLDGKPLEAAIVSFIPAGGANSEFATGVTDASGKYSLSVGGYGEGAAPGDYRVAISKFAMPDGSPVPMDSAPIDVGAMETIPPRYSDVSNETLKMTVPAGGTTTADFQLSK